MRWSWNAIGRKLAAVVLVGLLCQTAAAQDPVREPAAPPEWRVLRPGLEFALLAADSARSGDAGVAALRVDPRLHTFRVLAAPQGETGLSATSWREESGALAVFNAGQFTPQHHYLGLLIRDGQELSRQVSHLEGLFVAQPEMADLPPARVLDLRYIAFDPEHNPYRQAAQSLMLLDRYGHIRVRRSPKVAHRTAVAEDSRGRIIVLITQGGHTLWEFADFLTKQDLGLREVMCMDGGPEAQMDLKVGDFSFQQYGEPSDSPNLPMFWPRSPLPAALAIFPAEGAAKPGAPPDAN